MIKKEELFSKQNKMNWEEIDKILKEQIASKLDLQSGYNHIKHFLTDNGLPIVDINIDELKKEFDDWFIEVIDKEPIPKYIKSIYFGLSTMSFPEIDNGKEKTTVYIAGSKLTPSQDPDWACDTEYFPNRRYVLLDDFGKIDELINSNDKLSGDYEVLVFNGLLNLLVLNSIKKFKDKLLIYNDKKLRFFKAEKKREKLQFGAGFDSGDIYLLGELS